MAQDIKNDLPISIRKVRVAEMSSRFLLGEQEPIYDARKTSCE